MKVNQWTIGLAAVGLVSLPAALLAEEKMNPLLTAVTPTTVSGYVNTSIHWNPGTGNAKVPSYGLNAPNKADGFNLDVVNLMLDKPLDEGNWSAGYKVELLFGQDANAYATGSSRNSVRGVNEAGDPDEDPTSLANNGDFAIKQAYVALRAPLGNGLDFKVGVWDTITGYEVFNSGSNPNYTRSYGWTLEPTTFTGVLGSYVICKEATVHAGVANTYGPQINQRANPPKAESYKAYLVGLTLTAPDDWGFLSGSALYATFHNGFNSAYGDGGTTAYYIGTTLNTPWDKLKVGAAYDYVGTGSDGAFYANALALYTSLTLTEKLSLHLRGEYAWSDTTLLGSEADLPGGNSEVFALTTTLQYDIWKNVMSRLEVRWDHLSGDNDMSGFGGKDFDNPPGTGEGKRNAVLVALNIIYKF